MPQASWPDATAGVTSLEAAVARSAEVALDRVAAARAAIGMVIFGQERVVEEVLVTLLAGGYRRSGFGRRVVVAVGVAALLQVLMFALRARVVERPELWALMYLPALIGGAYVVLLLVRLSRPRAVPAMRTASRGQVRVAI